MSRVGMVSVELEIIPNVYVKLVSYFFFVIPHVVRLNAIRTIGEE